MASMYEIYNDIPATEWLLKKNLFTMSNIELAMLQVPAFTHGLLDIFAYVRLSSRVC